MKKIIIVILGFILFTISGVIIIHRKQAQPDIVNSYVTELESISTRTNSSGVVSSTEVYLSNPELIALSKVIVKGKITRLLGKYDYHCSISDRGDEIVTTRYLYEFETDEVLKGSPDEEMKISISKFVQEEKYTIGEEYIWCLQKIKGDYEEAYDCISFSQSLFRLDGEVMKRNGNEDEQITIQEFKELIDINDTDMSFREDKNSAYNKLTNSVYDAMYE